MMEEKGKGKKGQKATTTKVKIFDMVDYAIGGIERGEINVNIMKKFFLFIIHKLEVEKEVAFFDRNRANTKVIEEEPKEEEEIKTTIKRPIILNPDHGPDEKNIFQDLREFSLCGSDKNIELSCISIGSVFKGVSKMEDNTNKLLELPEQYNLTRILNEYENMTPTLLSEMWRMMNTIRQIFKNESDLSEINLTFEQYKEKMKELKEFNDNIRKGIRELTKNDVDETGRPKFIHPFTAVRKVLTKVNLVLELFPAYTALLYKVWAQLGSGTLPSANFFNNTPSFCGLESLITNNTYCFTPYETRKNRGDAPPTKVFTGIFLKLAQMIKYNDEKLRRLKSIEVQLDNLRLKNATKKEVQKLIERMAEVDGIGTATERLLCRVQKCEDLLCYLRQVVNKIYGCLTANPTTRYESEHIWACLLNPEENKPMNDGSENIINDNQIKNFQTQITKIDCEANIIDKNLMAVEAVKVDVKNLFSIVNELEDNKLDKCVFISELARKAEKNLVDEKVSSFCFTSTSENINAVISEILYKIVENDKESRKVISYLTAKVNSKSDMDDFLSLKEQSENKLRCLARKLITLHKFRTNNNLNNSTTPKCTKNNKNANASVVSAVKGKTSKVASLKEKMLSLRKGSTAKKSTSSIKDNENNNNENNNNDYHSDNDKDVEEIICVDDDSDLSDGEDNLTEESYLNESGERDNDDAEDFTSEDLNHFKIEELGELLLDVDEIDGAVNDDDTEHSEREVIYGDEDATNNMNNSNKNEDDSHLCVGKEGSLRLNTKNKKLCSSLNKILSNLNYINDHIGDICKYPDARENKFANEKHCEQEILEGVRNMKKLNEEFKEKVEKIKSGDQNNDMPKQYEAIHKKLEFKEETKEDGSMSRGEKRNFMFNLLSQSFNDVNCMGKDFKSNQSIDDILQEINDIQLGEFGQ